MKKFSEDENEWIGEEQLKFDTIEIINNYYKNLHRKDRTNLPLQSRSRREGEKNQRRIFLQQFIT